MDEGGGVTTAPTNSAPKLVVHYVVKLNAAPGWPLAPLAPP